MTRVLDRDALDRAADRLIGDARIDVVAVVAEARQRVRHGRRVRVATATTLVAAAAAALLVAGGAVPGVALPRPAPAGTPDGPGAVPDVVRLPQPWTPSATERPLTRVAYAVLDTRPDTRSGHPVWLVGADGGAYRWLPSEAPYRVSVSADGSRVAWVEQPPPTGDPNGAQADVVRILDVREGVVRQLPLPGGVGRGFAVEGTAFAPAGTGLAVWGADRGRAFGTRTTPRLYSIEAGDRAPRARELCRCEAVPPEAGFALTAGGRYVTGLKTAAGPAQPVLAQVNDADEPEVGLPPGPITQPLLVSPDGGTRYAVAGRQLTGAADRGRETFRYELRAWPPDGGPARVLADLGTGTAAIGLGVLGDGVVVSRWSTQGVREGNGTGPGEVLRVGTDGTVRALSRSEGTARVIGAAAAVAAGGKVASAAPDDRPALLQATWYGWQVRRGAGRVGDLPPWVLVLVGAGALAAVVRVARPARPGSSSWWGAVREVVGGAAVLTVVAVVGSGAVLVAGEVLGGRPPATPAAATAGAVLPRVLADPHREPPRAFDAVGRPATRRVSLVVSGDVAGREGTYALDAATGRLVGLDDLPGVDAPPYGGWSPSPNGRFLASPAAVVDLETARVRKPGIATPFGGLGVLDDGTAVATDDSGHLLVGPPSGPARSIALPGVRGYAVQPGGRVLVHFATGPARVVGSVGVVDVARSTLTLVPVPDAMSLAAYAVDARGTVVDVLGVSHLPGAAPGPDAESTVRALAAGNGGGLVALGPDPSGTVVLRRSRTASTPVDWETLTTVRLPNVSIQPAADVVAAARPVDVAQPWWAPLAGDPWRTVAGVTLAGGVLALLLAGIVVAAARRPRPFTETESFAEHLRSDTGG